MKHTLLLLVLLIWMPLLKAQDMITIEPATYQNVFSVDLSGALLIQDPTVTVTNNTDSTISIRWERFVLDQPESWETQICDPIECYFPIVSSNVDTSFGIDAPVVLAAGDSFKISIYITPNQTAGLGKFAIDFSLTSDPGTRIGSADFEVEVQSIVVNTFEEIRQRNYKVFPNPSTNFFYLSNSTDIDRIIVLNTLGEQMREYQASPGAQYNIGNFPNGLYFVRLINDNYGAVRTIRLYKRNFLRP